MKRRGEAAETWELIVSTAHDLFMTEGYRAVSTRQIAERCGVTQPALYHHFANKQQLYVEVLKTVLYKTRAALEEIAGTEAPVTEKLLQAAVYLLKSQPENSLQMFYDMQKELTAQSKQEVEVLWVQGFLQPIVHIFTEGMKSGALRSPEETGVDAAAAAYLLLNMLPKFNVMEEAEKQARMIVQVLCFGLAAQ